MKIVLPVADGITRNSIFFTSPTLPRVIRCEAGSTCHPEGADNRTVAVFEPESPLLACIFTTLVSCWPTGMTWAMGSIETEKGGATAKARCCSRPVESL